MNITLFELHEHLNIHNWIPFLHEGGAPEYRYCTTCGLFQFQYNEWHNSNYVFSVQLDDKKDYMRVKAGAKAAGIEI
jgi:hypothetical protein